MANNVLGILNKKSAEQELEDFGSNRGTNILRPTLRNSKELMLLKNIYKNILLVQILLFKNCNKPVTMK